MSYVHAFSTHMYFFSHILTILNCFGTFLIVSFSFPLPLFLFTLVVSMAPKHKSTPAQNPLRSRASSSSDSIPLSLQFRDDNAHKAFSENFLDEVFIQNAKSFWWTSPTLTFPLSFTVGNGSHCVTSWSLVLSCLSRSLTPCRPFAKGFRFMNMVMTFVLHLLFHYNSITEPRARFLLSLLEHLTIDFSSYFILSIIDVHLDSASHDKLIFPSVITRIFRHFSVPFPLSDHFTFMCAIDTATVKCSEAQFRSRQLDSATPPSRSTPSRSTPSTSAPSSSIGDVMLGDIMA